MCRYPLVSASGRILQYGRRAISSNADTLLRWLPPCLRWPKLGTWPWSDTKALNRRRRWRTFNISILNMLRPHWGDRVRVTTSMYRLMFTRPTEHHYDERTTEWVSCERRSADQVEMMLMRRIPRRGLETAGGTVVVTGDIAKPENTLPALEALLLQLVEPLAD